MINNTPNINKANYHLSVELTEHKKGGSNDIWYDTGNPGPNLGQVQQMFRP
jgi:hypothetical protein